MVDILSYLIVEISLFCLLVFLYGPYKTLMTETTKWFIRTWETEPFLFSGLVRMAIMFVFIILNLTVVAFLLSYTELFFSFKI